MTSTAAPIGPRRPDNAPLGEFELLARLRERLPPPGPQVRLGMGDDAAVTVPAGATATSVDAIVEGVHFRRDRASLRSIGRKGLATALSDLAAMGAAPGEAYVILGIPADLDEDGALEVLDGIGEQALATGTALAGGDVTRSPALSLSFTVVGHAAAPEQLVARGGAAPGDRIVVTGELGGAAAGLLLLEQDELAPAVPEQLSAALLRRQLDPVPRLAEGRALAAAGARAMIDLSDGLGADAGHIAAASSVQMRIEVAALPVCAGVREVAAASGVDPGQLAAAGGEDYELLACVPADRLAEAVSAVGAVGGTSLTPIGEVVAGEGVELRLPDGGRLAPGGFDQLR